MNFAKPIKLTPDQWQYFIDIVETSAPVLANALLQINHEGMGKEDHDDYLAGMHVAIAAMRYVKEFAADKVNFVVVSGGCADE